MKNQYGAKKSEEREGDAMVKVPAFVSPTRLSLARVSHAPYIFHAPATQANKEMGISMVSTELLCHPLFPG